MTAGPVVMSQVAGLAGGRAFGSRDFEFFEPPPEARAEKFAERTERGRVLEETCPREPGPADEEQTETSLPLAW